MTNTNTLSLAELNAVAGEFGLEFEETGFWLSGSVVRIVPPHNGKPLRTHGEVLADACEERSSRWCEPIRKASRTGYTHYLICSPFTLVD